MATKEERIPYFDYLRVLATIGVIILHVSSYNWWATNINGSEWQVFNLYTGIVRWCVPVFVMISGAIFLERTVNIKLLFRKHVAKMIIAYAIWSSIYYFDTHKEFAITIQSVTEGYYHLWFVPVMAGLYICVPLLQKIAKSEYLNYYLLLCFFVMVLVPSIITIATDFGNDWLRGHLSVLIKCLQDMSFWGRIHYGFYFCLGYWIHSVVRPSNKQRVLIYAMGIIGCVATVVLNSVLCNKSQSYEQHYFEVFSLNVMLTSVAVFVLFRHINFQKRMHLNRIVAWLGKYCFFIYLVHALVFKKMIEWWNINTWSVSSPVASVPVFACTIFVVSLVTAVFVGQILAFGRWILKRKDGDKTKREELTGDM